MIEQLQRSRDEFRIIAIFNDEVAAQQFKTANQDERHPLFVNGVISFEQLVDCLIAERFYPFSAFGTKVGKDFIAEIIREEVRKKFKP